jgi:RHS repeat-associated protein
MRSPAHRFDISFVLKRLGVVALWAAAVAVGAQTLPPPPSSPTPVTKYEYDAEGNPTKTVVAPSTKALATRHSYDALGRRTSTTDAKQGFASYAYDLQDQLTTVTDPRSLLTQYQPTGLGDVKQLTSPDTGTASSTFDAAGNLKTRTDARGVLATYSYDELNRLKQIVYSKTDEDSRTVNWTYDQTGASHGYGVGRLTTAATPDASTAFRYDALGRVTMTVQSTAGGNPLVVNTDYDSAGHITRLTYPSGRVVDFGWANGQPTSITVTSGGAASVLLDQISMSAFGPVQSWVWKLGGTARSHERIFDTSGRLVRQPLGNLIRDLTYDDADRISRYTHYAASTAQPAPGYDQAFSYDELSRLTTANGATNWSYGYDASGNRTAASAGAAARGYTVAATSNRLDALTNPGRSMAYDVAGNTLSDVQSGSAANYTATYSLEGRLAAMAQGSTTTASFRYDAFGRRVARTVTQRQCHPTRPGQCTTIASVPVLFAYDQSNHLIGEYSASGTLITEYVWLGDTPVAVIKPDAAASDGVQIYAIHADHLDTPRVILDAQGNVRWRWMGEPFGASAAEEQPTPGLAALQQNLRFPGQQYEAFGGRHYNHFRDYDPTMGRYVQSDPIGLNGGINTYAYVNGNPLTYVDPLGLLKIILLKETDPNYKSAVEDEDDPATCTVYSHGSSATVSLMNAKQLNKLLKQRGCKPKQPVKLDACRTGEGENSIGEQLAKLRKNTVIAPDQPVWDMWWGSSPYPPVSEDTKSRWNNIPNLTQPGNWRTFDGSK